MSIYPYEKPFNPIEFRNTVEQDVMEAMNSVWINPGARLGVTRIIRIHDALMTIRTAIAGIEGPERREASENLEWLYNVTSSFIEEKHRNIDRDSYEDKSPVEILDVCATTTQLSRMRFKRILELLKEAERACANLKATGISGSVFPHISGDILQFRLVPWERNYYVFSGLLDSQWDILIPRLRERVEQIAWQIHIGLHAEWKPGGNEWQNIEKFYGGLGQRVTMTRLKIPALLDPVQCLRKVYIATRPVDASERNPWQHRRKETEQYDSNTAGFMKGASRYVPVPCQHWALVVEEETTSAIWELGVVAGRIKIDKNLQYYPEPSQKMLVGYTAMTNDEISASAEDARKSMGDRYSFSTQNCQLFCFILFQFIRVSHTMSDAFSDLGPLPDDRVVPIVKKRLRQLGTTAYTDLLEVENLQPVPIFFGTLYTRALIVVTTPMLAYIFIKLGFVFFFLMAAVVIAWSPFAQAHTNLYPWSARRDPDRRRLRYLYEIDNTRKENTSGQFVTPIAAPIDTPIVTQSVAQSVTQGLGSQQGLFRQSSRIVEIDDEDEDINIAFDEARIKSIVPLFE